MSRRGSSPQKRQDALIALALVRPLSVASVIALLAILRNNVQRIGPVSTPATTVFFDSAPFTLAPVVAPQSPATRIIGSISVTDVQQEEITFQLIRDRGTVSEVLLTQQSTIPAGGEGNGLTTGTLEFLDTVDTVDANTGTPSPLLPLSIHTYSIVAVSSGGVLTGARNALIELEQRAGGHSATVPTPPSAPVNLATAGQYASFGSAGISNVPPSVITGDLGTPSTASSITGFALVLDGSGQFSTSSQVIGDVFAHDYTVPTPAKVTQANVDMLAAYTDASTRAPAFTDLFGGHLGGQTLTPGVYKWTGTVEIGAAPAGPLTLNGAGVYILQIAGTFDLAAATQIVLENGALPQDVFFAVAGQVTLHAGSFFRGELLAATGIATQAGAHVLGRLLAQTGVTVISSTITEA
jgi:hypothetical protein